MGNRKILVIFPHLGMGGVEKSLEFVSNLYYEAGNKVYVLSFSKTAKKHVKLAAGITVEYLQLPQNILGRIAFVALLRSAIKRISPDVIIAFRTDITRIVTLATWNLDIGIISSERGNPERYTAKQKEKYENALSKCTKIVFQTEFAKSHFNESIRKKGVVIPNPCIVKSDTQLQNAKREKVILSCGRLSKEKNFAGLIRAFSLISDIIPEYELHIYGDGPEKENLDCLIKDLGNTRIKILSTVDNVFAYGGNASLFVLNSLAEGMPNALIEAMVTGIPCISTDCPGGVVEFLADDGRRVRLVPRSDDEKLAEAIEEVIENPDQAQKMAKCAMEIKETLSPERIKKMWLKLLEEL